MTGTENEPPLLSSSGEEEEEEEEECSSESESEPDKTTLTPPPSSNKTQPTPNHQFDSSHSKFQTDNTPQLPNQPLTMNDDQSSKKPRSKNPISRYSPPPIKQFSGKRSVEEGKGSDLKRIKKSTVADAEKKQLFQRLWSEDNEIELIQGMIDYVEEKGKDPVADVNDFHEFVKESLHVDVNDKQMLAKARRLKQKFDNNVAKVLKNKGKVRSFSNPHEKKMYELSKNLWGNNNNNNNLLVIMNSSTKKVKSKVNVTPKTLKPVGCSGNGNEEVEPKAVGSMGLQITDEMIMNKGLELLMGRKKVEMEEKWKNLKVQELEHFLKKVDILKQQAEVVLNAITNSGAK